jgi:membrane-associated phospholipid phosphatase
MAQSPETETSPNPVPGPATIAPIATLALAGGIALGIVARGPNVLGRDADVTTSIQRMDGGAVHLVADIANFLGSSWFVAPVIAIALLVAALNRARPEMVFLAAMLLLRLAGTQLKPIFGSPRPPADLVEIIGAWDGTGYPSGHAMSSSTLALGFAVLAWRLAPSRRLAIAGIAGLVAYTLLVGWARIWTGAHWFSDVIGGYLFGVAITAGSLLVLQISANVPDRI